MLTIYEAHRGLERQDFETIEAGKHWVEAHGSGYVVTFHRGFDGKDRSGAMVSYQGHGVWQGVDISR
jgi:hypothetical protein